MIFLCIMIICNYILLLLLLLFPKIIALLYL
ncbi:hypothetical protein ACFW04_003972 [Cataglyphis niger]